MIIRRFVSVIIIIALVVLDQTFSFSKLETPSVPFDNSIKAVSHRISNKLSESEQTQKADYILNRFLKKWEVAGATVAIVKDGKLVYAKGYGYANVEDEKGVEPSNLFRIASVSKLITATAIMKLQEEGKLHLDDFVFGEHGILNDTIYSHIKDSRSKRIKVEHLLRHSAGYTSKYGDPMFVPLAIAKKMNVEAPIDAQTSIQFALSRRLNFTPGTRGSYSNLGYVILEKVIEKLAEEPYEDYVQSHVLHPSGIFDMHLGRSLQKDHFTNEVNYYEQSNAVKISAFDGSGKTVFKSNGGNNLEALGGAGAWVASAAELIKFMLSIDGDDTHPDILSRKSIKYMTTPNKLGRSPIGWMGTRANGTWWRTGSLAGTSALLKHQANGLSYVIITNSSTWRGSDFTKDLSLVMSRFIRSVKQWPDHDLFYHFEARPEIIALDKLPIYEDWS
ncbi:serine hydrolase domain-containing protein [Labilibaculum sp.]|uniref:serine hydrolase domain-containing protein n=1 Tax=Labilibaculum sp. TaxID=2060723 RepID=UPI003562AD06